MLARRRWYISVAIVVVTVAFAPSPFEPIRWEGLVRRRMTNMPASRTVGICDTQPMTIAGLQSLLKDSDDLQVVGTATNLFSGLELVPPGVVRIQEWRPDAELEAKRPAAMWGGIGYKR